MLKGLLQWLPYVLVLAVLYLFGRADFHIHQTIIFLGVIVALSIAMVASLFLFSKGQK